MADELRDLERDIARTRAELADTLRNLAARLFGGWGGPMFQRRKRTPAGAAGWEHAGTKPRRGAARPAWKGTARTVIGGTIALAVLVPRRLRRRNS